MAGDVLQPDILQIAWDSSYRQGASLGDLTREFGADLKVNWMRVIHTLSTLLDIDQDTVNIESYRQALLESGINPDTSILAEYGDGRVPRWMVESFLTRAMFDAWAEKTDSFGPMVAPLRIGLEFVNGALHPITIGLLLTTGLGGAALEALGLGGTLSTLLRGGATATSFLGRFAQRFVFEALVASVVEPAASAYMQSITGRPDEWDNMLIRVVGAGLLNAGFGAISDMLHFKLRPIRRRVVESVENAAKEAESSAAQRLAREELLNEGTTVSPDEVEELLQLEFKDVLQRAQKEFQERAARGEKPSPKDIFESLFPGVRRTDDQWEAIWNALRERERLPDDAVRFWETSPGRVVDNFDGWAHRLLIDPADAEARANLREALAAFLDQPPRVVDDILERFIARYANKYNIHGEANAVARFLGRIMDPELHGVIIRRRSRQMRGFILPKPSPDQLQRYLTSLGDDVEGLVYAAYLKSMKTSELKEVVPEAFRRHLRSGRKRLRDALLRHPEAKRATRRLVEAGALIETGSGRLRINKAHPIWRNPETWFRAINSSAQVGSFKISPSTWAELIDALERNVLDDFVRKGIFRRTPGGYLVNAERAGLDYVGDYKGALDEILNEYRVRERAEPQQSVHEARSPNKAAETFRGPDAPQGDHLIERLREHLSEDKLEVLRRIEEIGRKMRAPDADLDALSNELRATLTELVAPDMSELDEVELAVLKEWLDIPAQLEYLRVSSIPPQQLVRTLWDMTMSRVYYHVMKRRSFRRLVQLIEEYDGESAINAVARGVTNEPFLRGVKLNDRPIIPALTARLREAELRRATLVADFAHELRREARQVAKEAGITVAEAEDQLAFQFFSALLGDESAHVSGRLRRYLTDLRRAMDEDYDKFVRGGQPIEYRDGYIRRVYDAAKLRERGIEAVTDDLMQSLDLTRYVDEKGRVVATLTDEERRAWVREHAAKPLVEGTFEREFGVRAEEVPGLENKAVVAADRTGGNSLFGARALEFKSPTAEAWFLWRYGDSIRESAVGLAYYLHSNLTRAARSATLVEELGPAPREAMDLLIGAAVKADEARAAQMSTKKAAAYLRDVRRIREALGGFLDTALFPSRFDAPSSRAFVRTLANVAASSRLGWAVMWSAIDQVFAAQRVSVFTHRPFIVEAFATTMRTIQNLLSGTKYSREVLELLELSPRIMSDHLLEERFSTSLLEQSRIGDVAPWLHKAQKISGGLAQRVFRWSLLQQTTEATLRAVKEPIFLNLSRILKDLDWAALKQEEPALEFLLRKFGITEREWGAVRKLINRHPEVMKEITVHNFLGRPTKTFHLLDVREMRKLGAEARRLADIIASFVHAQAEAALNFPDEVVQHWSRLGAKPGSYAALVGSLMTLFRRFDLGVLRRSIVPAIEYLREYPYDGLRRLVLASSMLIGTAAVVIQLKERMRNRPTYKWDSPELWLRAVEGSGMFPVVTWFSRPVAELIYGRPMQPHQAIGEVLGPAGSFAADVFDATIVRPTKIGYDIIKGRRVSDDELVDAAVSFWRVVPAHNVWWLDTINASFRLLQKEPSLRLRRYWADSGRDLRSWQERQR